MDDRAEDRKDAVERIHASIVRKEYEVDASAVAEAIVKRLLEGRTLPRD